MSGARLGETMKRAGSWLGLDDSIGVSVAKGRDPSIGSSSATSYTTESSDGFVIDNKYVIGANPADDFNDDISTMVDSVATELTQQQQRSLLKSQRQSFSSTVSLLDALNEEEEEDSAQYEAYLKAKMFSLWGRIQDEAGIEEHSETPTTESEAKILDDFARSMRS